MTRPLTPFGQAQRAGFSLASRPVQGPVIISTGVKYQIWSEHPRLTLILYNADGTAVRSLPMQPIGDGFFMVTDSEGKPGDLYKYSFGAGEFPDPATRYQPGDALQENEKVRPDGAQGHPHPPVRVMMLGAEKDILARSVSKGVAASERCDASLTRTRA